MDSSSWLLGLVLPRKTPSSSTAAPPPEKPPPRLGVLTFEASTLMSKLLRLWHSLSDDQIARLRRDLHHLQGVRKLVSRDDASLLRLALLELLNDLAFLARATAGLGARCSDPVLRSLDLALSDQLRTGADVHGLEYPGRRKMEKKVRKMERLVAATLSLHQEMEVLAELEQALRRTQSSPADALLQLRQKVAWQRQEVKYLRDASLWNRSRDYAVRLLARSLATLISRIQHLLGLGLAQEPPNSLPRCRSSPAARRHPPPHDASPRSASARFAPLGTSTVSSGQCLPRRWKPKHKQKHKHRSSQARPSDLTSSFQVELAGVESDLSRSLRDPRYSMIAAPPSTLGSTGLSLHYANLVLLVEKLAESPRLIGPDARDDLYSMLPKSVRSALRSKLRSCSRSSAAARPSLRDPVLAAEWSDAVARILEWLAPMARNMVRWQAERNYEQQRAGSGTNTVLLVQTLYFANQEKTEAAITELLVGLNYLWRFGREIDHRDYSCYESRMECVSPGEGKEEEGPRKLV